MEGLSKRQGYFDHLKSSGQILATIGHKSWPLLVIALQAYLVPKSRKMAFKNGEQAAPTLVKCMRYQLAMWFGFLDSLTVHTLNSNSDLVLGTFQ
jgi:hypothetical protein